MLLQQKDITSIRPRISEIVLGEIGYPGNSRQRGSWKTREYPDFFVISGKVVALPRGHAFIFTKSGFSEGHRPRFRVLPELFRIQGKRDSGR
jgi:hypothetical protein